MKRYRLVLLVSVLAIGALPAAAGAPNEAWGRILAKIEAEGQYTPAADMELASFHLEDVQGPLDQDHVVDAVGVHGLLGSDGTFQPMSAFLASEDWKIGADGNWHIERWGMALDRGGALSRDASHDIFVHTRDYKGVSRASEGLSKDDARVRRKFDALIAHWASVKP
jgi:hypothetical protein